MGNLYTLSILYNIQYEIIFSVRQYMFMIHFKLYSIHSKTM